ncbi:type III secretion system chaperone [Bremerella sp. JC770]|uniref:type III secretion system chaperone n=1 Tax=Bremerella sp. JC770 TaxID=3232137 RepID=UPI00345B241C
MSGIEEVQKVLNELGSEMGLGELELDESQQICLSFEEVEIGFAYAECPVEILSISADLWSIPDKNVSPLRRILQLGYQYWLSGTFTIGLDQRGGRIIGRTTIPIAVLGIDRLRQTLRTVLVAACHIREEMERGYLAEMQ